MAFLQDDDGAFEAALSLLDEFASGATDESELYLTRDNLAEQAGRLDGAPDASNRSRKKAARRPLSEEERKRRRAQFNERRRLLRKAGVYGDANRARNERAREIASLREELEKLQVDLQILQSRHGTQKTHKREEEAAEVSGVQDSESQIMSLWQGIADQQRRRRQEAERDNVLLKLAVERQQKVASNLATHMQRRATQLTNECASLVTTTTHVNRHTVDVLEFHGEIKSFRGLFQLLDEMYRNLDDTFKANGLATMTISPVDVHIRKGADGKSLEFVSYKELPFDMHSTAEATWNHFKGVEKHIANGALYEKAEKDLDEPFTIIADFKKEVYSDSSRADIKVKQVIRRYVEQDRDITIWVSRAVPIEVKHKILRGLTYHLQGCGVTRRSPESTSDREVSVLQLCYKVSLDQDVEMRCDPTDLHTLINFLVATTVQNIRAHRERIENALVDRSLPRIQ